MAGVGVGAAIGLGGRKSGISSPSDLSNLDGWWTAYEGVTGDPVTQWDDRSGNGRHYTSAGVNRPDLVPSWQNGRAAVASLDGDDRMNLAAQFNWPAAMTILLVAAVNNLGVGREGLIDGNFGNPTVLGSGGGSPANWDYSANTCTSGTPLVLNQKAIWLFTRDGSNVWTVYKNNVDVSASPKLTSGGGELEFIFGDTTLGSSLWHLGEKAFWSADHAARRDDIFAYANGVWGIY